MRQAFSPTPSFGRPGWRSGGSDILVQPTCQLPSAMCSSTACSMWGLAASGITGKATLAELFHRHVFFLVSSLKRCISPCPFLLPSDPRTIRTQLCACFFSLSLSLLQVTGPKHTVPCLKPGALVALWELWGSALHRLATHWHCAEAPRALTVAQKQNLYQAQKQNLYETRSSP